MSGKEGGKKRLLLFAMLIVTALLAAACGEEVKTEESRGQTEQPITLSILTPSGGDEAWFMERYGSRIQKVYPNYSFEVIENVNNALENIAIEKKALDLIMTSFVGFRNSVKPLGFLEDMSDLIGKHQFDLNRIEKAYHDMIRNLDDGSLSALPLYDLSLVLYYNRDIFDKFAVEYPRNGMVWEDLYDTARRLTRNDGGVQYRGFVTAPSNLVAVNQYSLGYLNDRGEKAALQTDGWKRYIETFLPLYTMPGYEPARERIGSSTAIKNAFFKEKTSAMFVMFNSDAPKPEDGIPWDVVSLPEFKDSPGIGSQPYPVYAAVASTSRQRDEAFKALAQLLTDEAQSELAAEYAQITPLKNPEVRAAFGKNVAQWQGKNIAAITSKIPASPPAYVGEYNGFGQTAVTSAMTAVIVGEKDVNTALREAEEEVNQKVAEALAARK